LLTAVTGRRDLKVRAGRQAIAFAPAEVHQVFEMSPQRAPILPCHLRRIRETIEVAFHHILDPPLSRTFQAHLQ